VGILRLRQDKGVLDGDTGLVVVAIQDPLLKLEPGQFSFVHESVEGMVVVIAVATFSRKPIDEGFFGKRIPMVVPLHSVISMPSKATSHPAASTIFRSGESSFSIGLVLLMWMNTRRDVVPLQRAERLPPGPPTGQCASSWADFPRKPFADSSELDQKVPSKSTPSAPSRASYMA